jgi:hypothetical protein
VPESAALIRCHRNSLAARCRERGYTLDDVWPCVVSEDGDRIMVDVNHPAYPRVARPLPEPPRELPPLAQRVANFAASAAKHVAAGMPRATDEQIAERFAICQGCEFLLNQACSKCGCPVVREAKYISKLSWATESCPVGKWGPVASSPQST